MSDTPAEEEFTELVNPDITKVAAVKGGANGTSWLIAKSAAEQPARMFDPEFVRELVEKADAQPESAPAAPEPESVTLTATVSPAAIVRMMKEAADRAGRRAEYVAFVKAKYTAEDKRKLASQGHAMRNSAGEPDYPIDDAEDLGKAIHAVGRGGADHDKIRAYIIRRARAMGMSDQIPDNWASDGSLKQAAMAKADGYGASPSEPGSPMWEAQDASDGQAVLDSVQMLRQKVQALSQREGAEVGAGHMDDLGDVCDLQQVDCLLRDAAKLLGGFTVNERAEAGSVTKAQDAPPSAAVAAPSPQESTVSDTEGGAAADTQTTAALAKSATGLTAEQAAKIERKAVAKAQRKAEVKAIVKAAKKAAKANQTTGATGAPDDTARVIPGTDTVQSPPQGPDDVAKATASQLATAIGEAMAPLAKQLTELAGRVESQTGRVEKALSQPDDRRSPALNGATGEAGLAPSHYGRGFESRPEFAPIRKALDALPEGPEKEQARRDVALAAIKGRFGN